MILHQINFMIFRILKTNGLIFHSQVSYIIPIFGIILGYIFLNAIISENCLGIILACVSPENYENNLDEIQKLKVPFGFKLNGFITTKPKGGYTSQYKKKDGTNPNNFLGQRKDLDPKKISIFAKKFKENGATILGGCCETTPLHIESIEGFNIQGFSKIMVNGKSIIVDQINMEPVTFSFFLSLIFKVITPPIT